MASVRDVIAVTGSNGFIGSAAVKRLADRSRVVGLDREGGKEPPSVAEYVEVNLTSEESVRDGLPVGDEPFIKPWMIDVADDHYVLDIGRARTLLGWQPRQSLPEALPKMVAALEVDPVGWRRANELEFSAMFHGKAPGPSSEDARGR